METIDGSVRSHEVRISFPPPARNWKYKAVFKQVHKLVLLLALLWALAPSAAQAQVINCPAGFSSSGACGVALIGQGANSFKLSEGGGTQGLVGTQVDLVPANSDHAAISLTYQTQVNVQAFTASFTFVPNGWETSFIIQNSNNNPDGFNESIFAAGAGCEADFFQGYSQTVPPNYVFALNFDSYQPLIDGQPFTYSGTQIYTSPVGGYVQCPCQSSTESCGTNNSDPPITKISTSPVPLNSPVDSRNTTTGHTYSATVTYDGSNFTLKLYDVTAGGSCPGSSCFTNTWTNVDIPSSVGGTKAWVGLGGSTGSNPVLNVPLYIGSFVYTEGTPTSTPTPTPTTTVTPTVTPTTIPTPSPTPDKHPKNGHPA